MLQTPGPDGKSYTPMGNVPDCCIRTIAKFIDREENNELPPSEDFRDRCGLVQCRCGRDYRRKWVAIGYKDSEHPFIEEKHTDGIAHCCLTQIVDTSAFKGIREGQEGNFRAIVWCEKCKVVWKLMWVCTQMKKEEA